MVRRYIRMHDRLVDIELSRMDIKTDPFRLQPAH